MPAQALPADLEDWNAAPFRRSVAEAVLVALLNARLAHERPDLACAIVALRYLGGRTRNWEVARFELGDSPVTDINTRIDCIARILVRVAEGIDVDWPTVALH